MSPSWCDGRGSSTDRLAECRASGGKQIQNRLVYPRTAASQAETSGWRCFQ